MSVTTRQQNSMVLRPQTFDQLTIFADMAAKSSLVPRDYVGKPENIMLAIQMGSELGLAPMQALQNIAVVNGRPAVWGDAMLALVKAHPDFDDIQEVIEGDGEKMKAICTVHRRGKRPVIGQFSVEDAKRAGLWKDGPKTKKRGRDGEYEVDSGPWWAYPRRMLQMRARGFALRDAFPDALKGLISAEEARDIPVEEFKGTTLDARAEPPRPEHQAPRARDAEIVDELPPDGPTFRFASNRGGKLCRDAAEWIETWRGLIQRCEDAGAYDKIVKAYEMNAAEIAAAREINPEAADTVEQMIREADERAEQAAVTGDA